MATSKNKTTGAKKSVAAGKKQAGKKAPAKAVKKAVKKTPAKGMAKKAAKKRTVSTVKPVASKKAPASPKSKTKAPAAPLKKASAKKQPAPTSKLATAARKPAAATKKPSVPVKKPAVAAKKPAEKKTARPQQNTPMGSTQKPGRIEDQKPAGNRKTVNAGKSPDVRNSKREDTSRIEPNSSANTGKGSDREPQQGNKDRTDNRQQQDPRERKQNVPQQRRSQDGMRSPESQRNDSRPLSPRPTTDRRKSEVGVDRPSARKENDGKAGEGQGEDKLLYEYREYGYQGGTQKEGFGRREGHRHGTHWEQEDDLRDGNAQDSGSDTTEER